MMSTALFRCRLLILVLAVSGYAAKASTVSFTGNLRTDATVTSCGSGCTLGPGDTDASYAQFAAVVEDFTVSQTSTVQAVTFSYGGGVNGAGTVIPSGGFEPYLSLFDSAGDFLASTYFGTTCPPGANSVSGFCYDVLLDAGVLAPGTYELAISAYLNMSLAENLGSGTLADGFTGLGSLSGTEDMNFAVDVRETPTVPEPPSIVLSGMAAVILLALLRARRSAPAA